MATNDFDKRNWRLRSQNQTCYIHLTTLQYVAQHLIVHFYWMNEIKWLSCCLWWMHQGSTLRRARMPGACRSCPRTHKLLWLRAWLAVTAEVNFQYGHVLTVTAVYVSFTGLVQILAGHVKIFAGKVHFQNHVPNGHVNHMLNVKPCAQVEKCAHHQHVAAEPVMWAVVSGESLNLGVQRVSAN